MRPLAPALALLLALSPLATAQTGEPFAYEQSYAHASGERRGAPDAPTLVHGHTIAVPGAPTLRVFFDELDVPGGGWLDVLSPRDGWQHRLTAEEARKWGHSSAFFNTDTLVLELWAAPGERASFAVSHLLIGIAQFPPSICGADDRVHSTDNRSMRFLNGSGTSACSGWLAGPDDCAFCAGHCFPTFSSTAEVNVPPSSPGGALLHPPIEDQFPIDPTSLDWTNGGIGNDWAVSLVLPNHLGETPAAKWGYYELGFFVPSPGETIRITGFGADSGVDNQVNQTDTGPFTSSFGTQLRYQVDTEGGNSGSPVIHEATGQAVGIHTNGGCGGGGSNSGTSLLNTSFQSAWTATCEQETPAVPVASFATSSTTIVEGQSVFFTDTSSGVPTSWEWDFDGDGTTDSTVKKPSFTYGLPGTYTVELTASNSFGSDTVTMPGLITVNAAVPTTLPFAEDFQSGLPTGPEWLFFSSNEFGAIGTGSSGSSSPVSGDPSLTMAAGLDGLETTNNAVLFLDMTGVEAAKLTYWFKKGNDEADPEDGLFLGDGTTEAKVVDHSVGADWTQRTVDLVDAATNAGIALNEDFRIVWRQNDNFTLGEDGHLVDDILIQPTTTLSVSPPFVSASGGGTQVMDLDAGASFAGAPFFVIGSVTGSTPGFLFSDLLIPLNPDFYSVYTVTFPNTFPLSGSAGFLDAAGEAETLFTLPPGSGAFQGLVFHHAFVTGDLGGGELDAVSNAASLIILP